MNEKKSNCNSRISEKTSEASQTDGTVPTTDSEIIEDVPTSTQTTYATFFWILFYAKMFVTRLGKDLFRSAKSYFFPGQVLPNHVVDLMRVQSDLCKDRESRPTAELSESSLDVHIPSYPGSIRSVKIASEASLDERHRDKNLREAVDFLHRDNEFLMAAEIGNDRVLEIIMRTGTDIQAMDHLGRNALHLAVCADSMRAITLLLQAGVNPNIKDNLGMTPLSLCLMRRPSLRVANLLFDYGAKIMPRTAPMDTGLFIQFVMMSVPTAEEERILKLLVEKGACVNDSEAPGGRQAIHFAAMSNNCKLIEILVELGANLYLMNHKNQTPKEIAMTYKCREAHALLEALEMETTSS